jgi:hypothetical protein
LMYWFHTSLVLAWLWLKSAKLLASDSTKRTWQVNGAFIGWWHHSLDPYRGNEMVQQCWFLGVLVSYFFGIGLALAEICQTFGQRQYQEDMTYYNGAFIGWWHHSLDPYGGNEMVPHSWLLSCEYNRILLEILQWFLSCTCWKHPWYWLGCGWNLPNFWQATVPIEHNMSKISHTEHS